MSLREGEDKLKEEQEENPCSKPAYIGLFFDGTNNSYRHAIENNTGQESNVARLYDVFPGQCVPGILPSETDWKSDLDLYKRYFKIYVPGVGKAFPNIGDQLEGLKNIFDPQAGAGMATYGQSRIIWAIAQIVNHIYQYYWGGMGSRILIPDSEVVMVSENIKLTNKGLKTNIKDELSNALALDAWKNKRLALPILICSGGDDTGTYGGYCDYKQYWTAYNDKVTIVFREWLLRLKEFMRNKHNNPDNQPLRKIHFYTFGFSRGAAEARAFLNWFVRLCEVDAFLNNESGGRLSLAGIPVSHEFMGIFDTVASVGFADMFAGSTGHNWWADAASLQIPPEVGRCIHFVSAHEQRRCFPLDSVYQGQKLPEYCEEIVFPGVHSDIGGGYAPLDQGKGFEREGTSLLSRIPLIEMYRHARLAGVPLVLEKSSSKAINAYKIDKKLIDDFNKYLSFFDKKEGTTAELVTPHWLKQIKFRINTLNGNYPYLDSKIRAQNIDKDLRLKISEKEKTLKLKGDKKEISMFNISNDKVYVDRLNLADKTQKKSISLLKTEYERFCRFLDKKHATYGENGRLSYSYVMVMGGQVVNYAESLDIPECYEVKYIIDNIESVKLDKFEEYFIDNYIHDSIAGFCLDDVNEHFISGSFVYFRYRCIFSGSEVMYQVPYGNGIGYSREEVYSIKSKEELERQNKERDLQIMQQQMADQISTNFSLNGLANIR